jgi:glycosyltransferase involved in cell wall biosynthesis
MSYVRNLDASRVPDADAVFATAWETVDHVLALPPSKGARFYLIQHYETWQGPTSKVDATWRAPLHKVVVSSWLGEIGRKLGCENVCCIPYGIDHEKYCMSSPITGRPRRVAMLYDRQNWKGSSDGLRALRIVKDRYPDLRAAFFGTPQPSEPLPDWVQYFRNPPQETLVIDVYNGSSIFLCSSWAEGFSLPPAEAMACGCAVVATDCGGIREFAEPEVTALLSPPRDPEALARNILRLLDDDALRQRLAAAGHERIQSFTWERSTDQLERFIEKQVGSGTGTFSPGKPERIRTTDGPGRV